MPNRLANASSPYLRQHRDNPVDWYPWGEEAFARARDENKPIFLSVGYSSCHWCHVMAHESFEDEEVAAILNQEFISIKLDREERPDVDEAYMAAVQLTSGRGGWPMSVFLTPDRKPFFAGTYFPKLDRGNYPGFLSLTRQIAQAWRQRRTDLEKAASEISKAVSETLGKAPPATFSIFDQAFVDSAVRKVLSEYDGERGGFGNAPKFPPHTTIEFLMAYATSTVGPVELREGALGAALVTLQRMSYGGIHDHVGGGFHRYSTDGRWLLPHFEKMLYDNALLLANFGRASVIAEGIAPELAERFRASAAGIADWLMREMMAPDGTFYSALDADSEGEEGKFYVWTEDEVRQVLGAHADEFLTAYNFKPEGNYKDEATGQFTGTNIPHLTGEPSRDFDPHLQALRQARETRVKPGLDDKALTSWNGLVIGAFAEIGLLTVAAQTAEAFLAAEARLGHLPHQIVGGEPSGEGFLDDYAVFTEALLRLSMVADAFHAAGEPVELPRPAAAYLDEAERLAKELIAKFYDEGAGGFFGTSDHHEILFGRAKPVLDQPSPSGNAIGLGILVALGDEARARQTLATMLGWMERAPSATEAMYYAALPMLEAVSEAPVEAAKPLVPAKVEVKLVRSEIVAGADGFGHGEIRIAIPDGLHLNSDNPPARWLTPTKVEIRPASATVSYPAAVDDRYVGEISIPFQVELPRGKSDAEFEVRVSFQACTETECQLAEERVFGAVVLAG
ncbi:DUF255 domain-containing protein [Fimbriimonas ginsengisoli]|uniref:Thymidylate kinase n=1 Tax=Fimbriimonas ginsengisoli Gsoil 348 TaxID=661478 RepID=A0A068NVH7_FIMGI|nr:DUF255 domain-containing protein [Fimbriimonas ginsengisoli]AIE87523.1 Thymidylate kinase [Fimbriimonas ginsengisoli Gsoil 348]